MANNQTFTLNIKALFDASDIKAKVGDIQSTLSKLKLPDKLGSDLRTSFANVNKALDDFISKTEKGIKTKTDATGITKSFENVTKELSKLDSLVLKVKGQLGDGVDLSKIIKLDDKTINELKAIEAEIGKLQQKLATINTSKLDSIKTALSEIKTKAAQSHGQDALKLFEEGNTKGAINILDNIIVKLERYKDTATEAGNSYKQLVNMRNEMLTAQRESATTITEIDQKSAEAAEKMASAQGRVVSEVNNASSALGNYKAQAIGASTAVNDLTSSQAQFVREVDQVKSRIQYFFGISNAINLVKRAIRGAVDTVKDLDKAMTETAVVTKNTVSDMWAKLPEYTKRANELGVSTLDAYKAATLYYQQGLNDEQAGVLSVETLKMARIAGLDAAEATDRMTNALRGFNMELNASSAQKIDDVYSQLAAMSASNVDEISTAMTKVASLAHNANMEFETTAAFLAQIIETTRESAETAGTALKTVVARFSEVKKLVDTEQLKGTDEEGQVIDVNKVSAALRTAGIDLNKYFLGEVGLDDIFMELASKWDSLTNVQQRYIATQAAGSRQQSRFIALMQDYARTQELVGAAYNAQGASAKQFAKTQESLQSKLARLSNAWNEFLMGLANNAVIKTVVDLLTDLLNVVNKLTSVFGEGAGSFLKWISVFAAYKGLRSAFADGGIAAKAIGGLIGDTNSPVLNKIKAVAGLGKFDETTGGFTPYTKGSREKGPTIISGIGDLGKKAWGGAQKLGYSLTNSIAKTDLGYILGLSDITGEATGTLSATAAGITGIATALTAVATAAAAAYAAYRIWLKVSAKGQLKAAEKEAKKYQETEEQTKKTLQSLNSLQETYKEKTEEIQNVTSAKDRQEAIKERNQAVLDAISEDGTLAKYVITEQVDNQIVLTIDEEAFSTAAEKAAETAAIAAEKARFSESKVGFASAKAAESELRGLFNKAIGQQTGENASNLSTEEIYQKLSTYGYGTQAKQFYDEIISGQATGLQQAKIAYGQELTRADIKGDLANSLISILSDIYADTKTQLNIEDLQKLTTTNGLQQIMDAWLGQGKMTETWIDKNFSEDSLGYTERQLESFASILGYDINKIKEHIKAQVRQTKEIQTQNKANLYQKALQTFQPGQKINDNFQQRINDLSPQFVSAISNVLDEAEASLSDAGFNSLLNSMFDMSIEDLSKVQSFFDSFSLDNPIQAYHKLKEAQDNLAELPHGFETILNDIQQTNAALFDTGNLVQTFLTSESYDGLTASLEKFIEENGHISAKNIEELKDSCKDLQYLLDDTTVTAQGLAEALNALESGEAVIEGLTGAVLDALSAGRSFQSLIDDVQNWVKNFKATDLTEGTNFITEQTDKILELSENKLFGNAKDYYTYLFGKDSWDKVVDLWSKDSATAAQKIQDTTSKLQFYTKDEGLEMWRYLSKKGGFNIEDLGTGLDFKWDLSQFDSAQDVITSLKTELINLTGATDIADEAIISLITSAGAHMPDLERDWNNLNLEGVLKKFAQDVQNSAVVTEQELKVLASSAGQSVDEIKAKFEALGIEIPITVNWQDKNGQNLSGKALQEAFAEKFSEIKVTNGLAPTLGYDKFLQDVIDEATGNINFDQLHNKLVNEVKLTDSQANEIADSFGKTLSKTISIPKFNLETNEIEFETKTITADSTSELEAKVKLETEAADYATISQKLAQIDVSTLGANISDTMKASGEAGAAAIATAIENYTWPSVTIPVWYEPQNSPIAGDIFTGGSYYGKASGGLVKSYAKGSENFHVSPGTALTGEEGPELIWNKDGGYAYVTGQDGPEFADLHPGDRIFNASETKRIFKNSQATGGIIDSFASGGWKDPGTSSKKSGGSGSGGSRGGADDKTPEEWKNDLDWLYNLMEDIAELERDQKAIEEQYEDALQDQSKTGRDLYNLLVKQLGNLYTQLNHQTFALQKREQEMREFMDITNDKDQYLWYNWQDRTLEIDWDAIDRITDEEEYKHVKELVDEAEEIQDKMDDADDAIMDITNQIQELENIWRDTFTDFEKRVLDAVVKMYQTVIDNYSELNDTLNNSNQSILDSLQKEINLQRQIRDNTKTEEEISDDEARLAYLRRDTSGGNELAALQLQKELADKRESYEDSLVDQAISRLQDDNAAAQEQRERQIEIMQAQLDYQSENGEFNAYIQDLLTTAMGADGELLTNSDLVGLLKEQENWSAMSDVSKEVWDEELNGTFKEVAAFLLKQNAEENGTFYTALTKAVEGVSSAIGSYSQAMVKIGNQISSAGSSGGSGGGSSSNNGGTTTVNPKTPEAPKVTVTWERPTGITPNGKYTNWQGSIYATGGLNTQTGLAWLDGTPKEPEYVLNARQTDAFLRLADVLPQMMGSGGGMATTSFGSNYFNVSVNVDQISSNYDVDRMVDRIKDKLYDDASYRNVNTLSFLR